MCRCQDESALHSLVTCVAARTVWISSGLGWFARSVPSFVEWLNLVFEKTERSQWGKFAVVCWGLWKNRNSIIWDNKWMTP